MYYFDPSDIVYLPVGVFKKDLRLIKVDDFTTIAFKANRRNFLKLRKNRSVFAKLYRLEKPQAKFGDHPIRTSSIMSVSDFWYKKQGNI